MMPLDEQSRDLVIRTVLGEAANEPDEGMRGVAAVIRNRLQSGRFGKSASDVVLARHQFEPWSTESGRRRMSSYAAESPAYKRAAAAVDAAFAGDDPTGGATHFFAPKAQAALGRDVPKWAQGEPVRIGGHDFFAPEGRVKMASAEVSDPEILARFQQSQAVEVTDPEVLARFRGQAGGTPPAETKTSPLDAALSPITTYPETYSAMRRESEEQMSRGVDQLKNAATNYAPGDLVKGIGNVAMGGLGFIGSPINAAYRTTVGKPIEDNFGVPKEVTEFAAALATPGLGLTRAGALQSVSRNAPNITIRPTPMSAGDEAVNAAHNLSKTTGVDVTIPRAVASDSIVANQAGRTVANVPIAGALLRKAGQATTESLDEAATIVRGEYGLGDMASAGAAARSGIEDAVKSGPFKQKVTQLYDAVDSLVNPVVTAPMPNTRIARDGIAARHKNAGLPESRAADGLEEALNRPGLNYEGIKDLRTYYGEMIDGNIPIPQGMTDKEVRHIYGALSKDMRLIIAKAGGPSGLAAFEKANREAERWARVRETIMPLLKVKNDEGIISRIQAAASSSSRADIKLLGRVRGAVGAQKWDEISSAILETMLHPPGGAYGQSAVPASFDKFVTAYSKLSDQGKQMLFRSTNHTPHADAIDDIMTIASRVKSHNQYANPSGTGQSVMTGASIAGAAVDPFTTFGTLVGANVVARVLAKPATARSMAAWSRAYKRYALKQTPANQRGYENASRLFAASVGTELSRSDVIPTLTRQLQGAMPGRAEEE